MDTLIALLKEQNDAYPHRAAWITQYEALLHTIEVYLREGLSTYVEMFFLQRLPSGPNLGSLEFGLMRGASCTVVIRGYIDSPGVLVLSRKEGKGKPITLPVPSGEVSLDDLTGALVLLLERP